MPKGRKLTGQQYDPEIDTYVPFTEQVLEYQETATKGSARDSEALLTGSEGLARSEQIPMDAAAARLRQFDLSGVLTSLDSYSLKWPGVMPQLQLPDILKGISVTYTKNKGEGHHDETGQGQAVGSSGGLNLSLAGRAQSSLSINADVSVNIKRIRAQQLPVQNLAFYLSGDVTQASLLAKCSALMGATVNPWPTFLEESHTLVLKGRNMSISVEASVQQSLSFSANTLNFTRGKGSGASYEAGLVTRTVQIPPTIHGIIPVSGAIGASDVITARANVSWPANGPFWPEHHSDSVLTTDPIFAEVAPLEFAATTPSALPSTGLYLYDVQFFSPKWGSSRIHAVIVDFSVIPNA